LIFDDIHIFPDIRTPLYVTFIVKSAATNNGTFEQARDSSLRGDFVYPLADYHLPSL